MWRETCVPGGSSVTTPPGEGPATRVTVPSRMIDERPAVVEERSRVGDFDGHLIVGRHGTSAIGTLVDRTTQFLRLVHLPDVRHGEATAAAISAAVSDLPMPARRTPTWDQGAEMARHDLIAHLFPEGVYSADPGSPWQRGTNENMSGLRASTSHEAWTCGPRPSATCDGSSSC